VTAGLCECGCGAPTVVQPHTDRSHGWEKGVPRRFIQGHNNRLRRAGWHEEDRGHTSPCHVWDGYLNNGYPRKGKASAYRKRWIEENGDVPHGLELDHLCRQRDCVNPNHLEAVTHQENMRRASVRRAMEATNNGSGIELLRARLGWSQLELGESLGVSRALVGLWERGHHPVREPHLARLMELAINSARLLQPDAA
jgi:DNA-binding transcriptional regulator YiaG